MTSEETMLAMSAILHDDISTVQTIMQWPHYGTIRDENGNNLLQMSIIYDRISIFDYLLSLDKFDLESSNYNTETPLMLTLNQYRPNSEYFAFELIKKGADVHSVRLFNNTILHFALFRRYFQVAEIAVEKGVDLDVRNDAECTALHMLLLVKSDPEGVDNGVGLMLWNGADVSIPDYNGYTPFELAILCGSEVAVAQENLFYHTFDNFTENFEMPAEVFFALIEQGPTWFGEILDKIEVVFEEHVVSYPLLLLVLDCDVLKSCLRHFDYVVRKLLESEEPIFGGNLVLKEKFIENLDVLIQSHLKEEALEFISRLRVYALVGKLTDDKVGVDVATEAITYLLSYGLQVWEYDLEVVYKHYGFCDLFKTLLYMDVKKNRKKRIDIIPKIMFDVKMEVKEFIGQYYTQEALAQMLCYFSQPDLRNLCFWSSKELADRVTSLPNVPLLLELARDVARKFLLDKFNITKTCDFFTLLKKLPITRTHEEILTYERKLY